MDTISLNPPGIAPDQSLNVNESMMFAWPKPVWRWDMFGGGQVVVTLSDAQPEPTWRQRFLTRVLFGSKWTRVAD